MRRRSNKQSKVIKRNIYLFFSFYYLSTCFTRVYSELVQERSSVSGIRSAGTIEPITKTIESTQSNFVKDSKQQRSILALEDWIIERNGNATITFGGSSSEELVIPYRISDSRDQLLLEPTVIVYPNSNCSGVPVDSNLISSNYSAVDYDGSGFGFFNVSLNINTNTIEGSDLWTYTSLDGSQAMISMCVRVDGVSDIDFTGDGLPDSILFVETYWELTINMNMGFNSMAISVEEDPGAIINEDVQFDYDIPSCLCDINQQCYGDGKLITQNDIVNLCLSSPDEVDIVEIKDVSMSQGSVSVNIVQDGVPNAFSNISVQPAINQAVITTRVISIFVSSETPEPVIVSGTVLLNFSGRRRRSLAMKNGGKFVLELNLANKDPRANQSTESEAYFSHKLSITMLSLLVAIASISLM